MSSKKNWTQQKPVRTYQAQDGGRFIIHLLYHITVLNYTPTGAMSFAYQKGKKLAVAHILEIPKIIRTMKLQAHKN